MTPQPSFPSGTMPGLPDKISVLVLDDMRFDRLKIVRLCTLVPMECEVTEADSLSAFNLRLDETAFDLIFVDYELPDGSGLDALELIRLSPRNCNAVSIMVTGFEESSIAFGAMNRGCADYITKDELSPSSFERAVTNALQKSVLSAQVESQTYARIEVEAVLSRFAKQSISDIKPMVDRMIRQLRSLRENSHKDKLNEKIECVEATCQSLSEFVAQLETQCANMTMSDLPAGPTAAPLPKGAIGKGAGSAKPKAKNHQRPPGRSSFPKPKRPPSPFSGRPL